MPRATPTRSDSCSSSPVLLWTADRKAAGPGTYLGPVATPAVPSRPTRGDRHVMTNESHQSTSGQPTISRRGLLVGTTALGLAAAHAVTTAGAGPAAAAPGEPLGPINYDSAALTGAARGAAYLDGAVYIASRHNVAEGTIRLAAFDPFTGEAVSVHDLDIGARSGNNVLTADDRYVYIGAAGNASVWRFDPSTGTAEPFAPIGTASTWTYRL